MICGTNLVRWCKMKQIFRCEYCDKLGTEEEIIKMEIEHLIDDIMSYDSSDNNG